jgi:anthranilate synthase component II
MLLMIDNYDSFTYNLVQYFGELGANVQVHRNDQITLEQIDQLAPDLICISPGPCSPTEAGVSIDVIKRYAGKVPIVRAKEIMHGKTSPVTHQQSDVFAGLPSPFTVIRYHSLAIERASLPDSLIITAETPDGEIMGVRHRELPLYGVQFHPESVLSEQGHALLNNFLTMNHRLEQVPA